MDLLSIEFPAARDVFVDGIGCHCLFVCDDFRRQDRGSNSRCAVPDARDLHVQADVGSGLSRLWIDAFVYLDESRAVFASVFV